MEFHEFIQQVKLHKNKIYAIIAVFLVLAAGTVALQRFKYGSKSQVLVVQEHNRTLDAYTVSKSNEYLSSVLASVVTSNSFFVRVLDSGFAVEESYFGLTPRDQMKEWKKTVNVKSLSDSGIIAISVYHPDRAQAEKIIRSVNHVLMTQHGAYHGSGESVKVRLIDQPVTSNFPVKPNIPLIAALAVALGAVTGLVYVYLLPRNPRNYSATPNSLNQRMEFSEMMREVGAEDRYAALNYAANNQPNDLPNQNNNNRGSVRVSGQRPEEALARFHGQKGFSQVEPAFREKINYTPYGQYEKMRVNNTNQGNDHNEYNEQEIGEGGYLEEVEELEPEKLSQRGSMNNIL
ncbi:MAG: GNVR domain-containing protein [Patescibacteria group bacterium]|nr:MAG: GNVR domain-containing protein [Patescibacteria group bacterium]